jgi:hypothetical protein
VQACAAGGVLALDDEYWGMAVVAVWMQEVACYCLLLTTR